MIMYTSSNYPRVLFGLQVTAHSSEAILTPPFPPSPLSKYDAELTHTGNCVRGKAIVLQQEPSPAHALTRSHYDSFCGKHNSETTTFGLS